MTTGEYLVAHSTLPSGTALQHLLALQIGSGQGTVFCSQFNVRIERQELTVTRKAKRSAAPEAAQAQRAPVADKQQKTFTVLYRVPTMTVFDSGTEEMAVTQRTVSAVAMHKLDNRTITKGAR